MIFRISPKNGTTRHHIDMTVKCTPIEREAQLRWLVRYPGKNWKKVALEMPRLDVVRILTECSRLSRLTEIHHDVIPLYVYDALLARGKWDHLVKCCLDNDLSIDMAWPIHSIIAADVTLASKMSDRGYRLPHNYVHRRVYSFVNTLDEYMSSHTDRSLNAVIHRWQKETRKKSFLGDAAFSDVIVKITSTSYED